MKILIIIFLILLPLASNAADKKLVIDNSKIEVKRPSESSIAKFKSDKNFIYDEAKSKNWWDAFWEWIRNQLTQLLGTKAFGFFQTYLGYIIILAAIIIVILVLNKSKMSGLFYYRKENKISGFREMEENINEIDFDALISGATARTEYRTAVRLYYLKTLKLLSDRRLIEWKINKTNHNYVKELNELELKKSFKELTYLFEWIWYGELHVERSLFEETRNNFMNFQNSLVTEK